MSSHLVYKDSAYRIMFNCQELVKVRNNLASNSERNMINLNVFYLAGHIIECISSYCIYELSNYPRSSSLYSLNESTVAFRNRQNPSVLQIYRHDIEKKLQWILCNCRSSKQVLLLDKTYNKVIPSIVKSWNIKTRYCNNTQTISENDVDTFLNIATKYRSEILQHITP